MKEKLFYLLGVALALANFGCATATPQADQLFKVPLNVPSSAAVAKVPFVNQTAGHCGPATLTMVLQHYEKPVTVEQIASLVYTPGVEGSFQTDMISASRRQGMVAIPIQGIPVLLKEVSSDHPVIVFENLALSWLPQWHYAVVYGYDLGKKEVLMHSGPEEAKRWDLQKFERSWKLADYWGLVVLPAGRLSATANEMDHVRATAALENLGLLEPAEKSYRSILAKWPDSLGAAIGTANVAYAQGNKKAAVEFLKQAVHYHPDAAAAWHNLAIAYGSLQNTPLAKQSAKQALHYASPQEKPAFTESLKDWL